jgi:hypothetical protein
VFDETRRGEGARRQDEKRGGKDGKFADVLKKAR